MKPLAILSAPGSRGDVNPMLAIAAGLAGRGWDVRLATSAPYAGLGRAAGIAVDTLLSDEEFGAMTADRDLWHPRRGLGVVFGETARRWIGRHVELVERHRAGRTTVLVAHPLDFASSIVRDADPEVRMVRVALAPIALRTPADPPRLTGFAWEPRRPAWAIRAGYRVADSLLVDRWLAPTINALRGERRLPPIRRVLDRHWLSPDLNLALFPAWFGPDARLHAFRATGFPLADGSETSGGELPPELEEHLARRPVVFTHGTANHHAGAFFAAACTACARLGVPGLLLTSHGEQLPGSLPAGVRAAGYVPFSRLLPLSRAVVHHGGIGTTSQALAAGTPQLVVPLAFDQFDNGQRIRHLDCGDWLPARRLNSERLAAALRRLLAVPNRCEPVRQQVEPDGVARAVEAIENVITT